MAKTSITKSVQPSTGTIQGGSKTPTVEELLSPSVGALPAKVRLIHGDATQTLSSMPTKSVGLVLTSPPVEILTTDGKTTDVRFDASWIEEAIRVADVAIFTIHGDALASLWRKNQLPKTPERISVWTIGDQGRFGIKADSANLILCYGRHPGLRSLPDVIVAPIGDFHWPPSEFHPSPGSYYLAYQIIEHLKPRSVLDPFMGSGVTLHAAITAGCEEVVGIDNDEKWVSMVRNEAESRGINSA